MSTLSTRANATLKNATCAVAALLITAVVSLSLVHSSARAPLANGHVPAAKFSTQSEDSWFGQPEPAVLVD